MSDVVHIALAANHRYVKGLRATLVSLVNACKAKERLRFHVFSDGLTDADKSDLVILLRRFGYDTPIDFREPDMKPIAERFNAYYGTHTTYIRLFFSETLPELDWVLWVDVDTLWFKDPADLWDMRNDSNSLLWSEDLPSTKRLVSAWHRQIDEHFDSRPYCCAGVVLMNLAKMRREDFIKRAFELVDRYGTPPFADQGVFNALCAAEARVVDDTWDLLKPNTRIENGVVLHFNGLGKHFNECASAVWRPLYEIWFRYDAQVLEGRHDAEVVSLGKRLFFWILGTLYPFSFVVQVLPMRPWHRDNIRRTLYFAWLRGRVRFVNT